jgi:hypothetical protein
VRRRTLLWRPQRRMRFDLDAIGVLLGVVALPLLALEWVVAGLLSLVAAAGRIALRRPWRVEAVLPGATARRLTWNVAGWRAAGRRADQVRAEIAAGHDPSHHADERAITAGG